MKLEEKVRDMLLGHMSKTNESLQKIAREMNINWITLNRFVRDDSAPHLKTVLKIEKYIKEKDTDE